MHVFEARDLVQAGCPLVQLTLVAAGGRHQCQDAQRTSASALASTADPKFNERVHFSVDAADLSKRSLLLSVWDMETNSVPLAPTAPPSSATLLGSTELQLQDTAVSWEEALGRDIWHVLHVASADRLHHAPPCPRQPSPPQQHPAGALAPKEEEKEEEEAFGQEDSPEDSHFRRSLPSIAAILGAGALAQRAGTAEPSSEGVDIWCQEAKEEGPGCSNKKQYDEERSAVAKFLVSAECSLFKDVQWLEVTQGEVDALLNEGEGAQRTVSHLRTLCSLGSQYSRFKDLIPDVASLRQVRAPQGRGCSS